MKKTILFALYILPLIGFSQFNITFQVDMNQYAGNVNNVEVFGTFNNFQGGVSIMADNNNDGVYDITIPINAGQIEFLFAVDSASFAYVVEDFTGTQPFCTLTTGQFTNRVFQVTSDTTLSIVCWEACVDCANAPSNSDVTLVVDMNNYQGSYTDVHLNGSFNNWCGNCAPMNDPDGDNVYELTVSLPNGDTSEYKFTVDNFTDQEMFAGGETCTKTTVDAGGQTFVNRFFVANGDTTLPDVCWNYCVDCASIGIDENWMNNLSVSPNPSNGHITITGELNAAAAINLTVFDLQGRRIIQDEIATTQLVNHNLDLSALSDGIYLLTLNNGISTTQQRIVLAH